MDLVSLFGTEMMISRIIFGCEPLGGTDWGKVDEQKLEQSVSKALDLGINCFDVADVYGLGRAEERLAEILGAKRHEVVIISKFGVNWQPPLGKNRAHTFLDSSPHRVITALENSLRRLKLDCIPIYLIHWPDPNTPIEETIEALCKCQDMGKIQHFGVSNFPLPLLQQAHSWHKIPFVELQYNLVDRSSEIELLPYCLTEHINVFAYGSLAQGLLTGKYDVNTKFSQDDRRHRLPHFQPDTLAKNLSIIDKLNKLSEIHNKKVSQVAIRWLLDQPGVSAAIVGAKTPEQTEMNIAAFGWHLSEQDQEYLNSNQNY